MNKRKMLMNELKKSLIDVDSIKEAEYKLQDTIERLYPDKCWWQTTNVQIFEELFFNRISPIKLIMKIVNDIEPRDEGVGVNEKDKV